MTDLHRSLEPCATTDEAPSAGLRGVGYTTPRPNLLDFGKPFGGSRPASARLPRHSANSFMVAENSRPAESRPVRPSLATQGTMSDSAPCGIAPGQAVLGNEGHNVGQSAVLVFLQPHAAAARHLRHLIDPEDQ